MMAADPMVELPLAFSAGLLTVAAPCILPMLPILLGAAVREGGRLRPACIVLGFIAAFSGIAFVFGSVSSAIGLSAETLRNGAILMLLVFGALMVWPRPFQLLGVRMGGLLNRIDRVASRAGPGNLGGLVLGASMGAVWTPCAGPALGSILALVAAAKDPGGAALLLLSYAAGAGIPMLAIAYGGQYAAARVRRIAPHSYKIQQTFGVLIVLTAAAMYFQYDTLVTVWLSTLA
jgi:cytochrome c biogenesis protein CcdA